MTTQIYTCHIWGVEYEALGYAKQDSNKVVIENSARAGGGYVLISGAKPWINQLSNEEKARLTTWLIDQRSQRNEQPEITTEVIQYVKNRRPLPAHERAERLLHFIAEQTNPVGTSYGTRQVEPAAYAWSESVDEGEIGYFVDYLTKEGWIDSTPKGAQVYLGEYLVPARIRVAVDGRRHIADQITNLDSSQAFVAMWFDKSMDDASKYGIEKAIEDAGYVPLRIDRKEHINKIDDEIIAEIRRSRFVVADFTHGDEGVRGGVYYEAGFAHGLDLPVIFTCREDAVEALHFDTEHYNHIVWTTPEELREKLKNRILAVIGEGPELRSNP